MNTLVCDAIRARRLIRFVYEGYERILEVHIYGINSANHEMVAGWLVGGWSASRPEPGWRNYLLRDMADVHALAETFEPRPNFNPANPLFRQIYCHVPAGAGAPTVVRADAPPTDEGTSDDSTPPVDRRPGADRGSDTEPPPPT
jgi:hypothetical protein